MPPLRRPLAALALALGLGGVPLPAGAHPHVFIDTGVDFLFDDEGRLTHIRVSWLYDFMSSFFFLDELGIVEDPPGQIDAAAKAELAEYQSQWIEGYEGDSYLWDGDTRIGLSGPLEPRAEYHDGLVEIVFLRAVETPFVPGADSVVKVYDPTYFSAYFVKGTPRLENAPEGCRASVRPFEPSTDLAALQQSLLSIPIDQDPEDSEIGALFADRVYVSCD
jgi:ABC-type uncharacterized transport system substrate-binding protein